LRRPGIIRSFGAHVVFTARFIEVAGLETVFLGASAPRASLLALPNVGLPTLTEMADAVRRMAQRVTIPAVADGNTSHGDRHNAMRTVRDFEHAGAAGILLEDQASPKRCRHFRGKQVIPAKEIVIKRRGDRTARRDPRFVIAARPDGRWTASRRPSRGSTATALPARTSVSSRPRKACRSCNSCRARCAIPCWSTW
jgi:2-methylisocitrate lyase-like PEP mutase family enzyme